MSAAEIARGAAESPVSAAEIAVAAAGIARERLRSPMTPAEIARGERLGDRP